MVGYVKIDSTTAPYYILLAEDSIKFYSRLKREAESNCKELKYGLNELNQAMRQNKSIVYYYNLLYDTIAQFICRT